MRFSVANVERRYFKTCQYDFILPSWCARLEFDRYVCALRGAQAGLFIKEWKIHIVGLYGPIGVAVIWKADRKVSMQIRLELSNMCYFK